MTEIKNLIKEKNIKIEELTSEIEKESNINKKINLINEKDKLINQKLELCNMYIKFQNIKLEEENNKDILNKNEEMLIEDQIPNNINLNKTNYNENAPKKRRYYDIEESEKKDEIIKVKKIIMEKSKYLLKIQKIL